MEETIRDIITIKISSKKAKGVVKAYQVMDEIHSRLLQTMKYGSVDNRRHVIKVLLGIWGSSISYYQIVPENKSPLALEEKPKN